MNQPSEQSDHTNNRKVLTSTAQKSGPGWQTCTKGYLIFVYLVIMYKAKNALVFKLGLPRWLPSVELRFLEV